MVSVTSIQLYHYSAKAAKDNIQTNEHGCVPIKFYLQEQMEARIGLQTLVCLHLPWGLWFYRTASQRLSCSGDNIEQGSITSKPVSNPYPTASLHVTPREANSINVRFFMRVPTPSQNLILTQLAAGQALADPVCSSKRGLDTGKALPETSGRRQARQTTERGNAFARI
jgi:hypothetical protein